MSKGIQNLKEIVDFGMAVEKAGIALFNGGVFHPDQLTQLLAVVPTVGPAIADIGEAIPELTDLDGAEAAELSAYVIAKGTLPEHAAKVVAKSLALAAAAWDLYKTLKEGAAPVTA